MRPRTFWFITSIVLCHLLVRAQTLTNALPPAQQSSSSQDFSSSSALPNDPSQEMLPLAVPEASASTRVPVSFKADRQTWANKVATLYGVEEFHYRDYVISLVGAYDVIAVMKFFHSVESRNLVGPCL